MKKILYIVAILSVFSASCKKKLEGINVDPNQFTVATPEVILHGVFKKTADAIADRTQEYSHWIFLSQIAGGRYDNGDGGFWQNCYVNLLEPIQQVINQYGDNPAFSNRIQIARIWQSYIYSLLVSSYGPIPMTQANSTEHLTYVHFEPEDSVEMKILGTLKDAASKIDVTKDKLTFDAIYAGDLLKWKKLANTLRLRLALQCTRNLGSIATAIISEVMADEANTIGAATDAFKMTYENINNNENPFWRSQIKNNPANLPKLNDFLLAFFRSYKDPRLAAWYDPQMIRCVWSLTLFHIMESQKSLAP